MNTQGYPHCYDLDAAHAWIDGRRWKLDGVAGTLHVVRVNGLTEVEHRASKAGRQTKAYRDMRAQLGDDYTTTLGFGLLEDVFAEYANWCRRQAARRRGLAGGDW